MYENHAMSSVASSTNAVIVLRVTATHRRTNRLRYRILPCCRESLVRFKCQRYIKFRLVQGHANSFPRSIKDIRESLRLVNVILSLASLHTSIDGRHLVLVAFGSAVEIIVSILLSSRRSEVERTCRGIGASIISRRTGGRADGRANLGHAFDAGRFCHALDFTPQGIQLLLHAAAKHVDVESCAVPAGPRQDDDHESRRSPAVPEPEWTGDHSEQGVRVLDAHEGRLLQAIRHREDKFAEWVVLVALAEEGEGGRVAGGDLATLADSDEEVIAELPDGVGESDPYDHGAERVMFGRSWLGELDGGDGGESGFEHFSRKQVHYTV